jgi:hypothetical protein
MIIFERAEVSASLNVPLVTPAAQVPKRVEPFRWGPLGKGVAAVRFFFWAPFECRAGVRGAKERGMSEGSAGMPN